MQLLLGIAKKKKIVGQFTEGPGLIPSILLCKSWEAGTSKEIFGNFVAMM